MDKLKINSPVMRYHGGKFRLAKWVISHFPDHQCYVEPFGGAAGVLLQKARSYSEVYNDLDGEVVNLFRVLRDPEKNLRLKELCALTPYSREEFELACQPAEDCLEQARRMVVRATMGFGTASAVCGQTGFRTDTKRKYATAMHLWSLYPDHLAAIGQRFSAVLIENKCATDVINKHDAIDTLHYCDPPYLQETRVAGNRYYRHEMSDAAHEELLMALKSLNGYVVLSGYNNDLYNDLLSGWVCKQKESRISAGRGTKVRKECLWLSPNTVEALKRQEAA